MCYELYLAPTDKGIVELFEKIDINSKLPILHIFFIMIEIEYMYTFTKRIEISYNFYKLKHPNRDCRACENQSRATIYRNKSVKRDSRSPSLTCISVEAVLHVEIGELGLVTSQLTGHHQFNGCLPDLRSLETL